MAQVVCMSTPGESEKARQKKEQANASKAEIRRLSLNSVYMQSYQLWLYERIICNY